MPPEALQQGSMNQHNPFFKTNEGAEPETEKVEFETVAGGRQKFVKPGKYPMKAKRTKDIDGKIINVKGLRRTDHSCQLSRRFGCPRTAARLVDLPEQFADVAAMGAAFKEAQATITRLSQPAPDPTPTPKATPKDGLTVDMRSAMENIATFNENQRGSALRRARSVRRDSTRWRIT